MHLDLASCPSARLRRDRESPFKIEMRRDHLTLEIVGRDQGFYSRSWVEIRSVRRNYIRTVRISMYVPWYYHVHTRTYVHVRTPSELLANKGAEIEMTARVEISQISSRGVRSRCTSTNFSLQKREKIHSLFCTYSYVECLGRGHGTVFGSLEVQKFKYFRGIF
jgi:hypothetical protein